MANRWGMETVTDLSWTIKKAYHQRIDTFELCCWRRLLRVPWTARRSNQSILKEISPGCSLEGLILKLLYFYHTTASLFVMTFLCLTIVYQELYLFSERVSMPAKNSLLLFLKKNQLRILSKALSNTAEFIHSWRKLSTQELMLLNCGVREDSWESLGQQGDPTSQS